MSDEYFILDTTIKAIASRPRIRYPSVAAFGATTEGLPLPSVIPSVANPLSHPLPIHYPIRYPIRCQSTIPSVIPSVANPLSC